MATPTLRSQASAERSPSPPPAAAPADAATVMLRGVKAGTLAVRGLRSGRVYLFTGGEITAVASLDVPALLRSGAAELAAG